MLEANTSTKVDSMWLDNILDIDLNKVKNYAKTAN
jgi:hypothetical protein